MALVSKEVATKDIDRWLDYKKVRDSKREANKEYIDSLVAAVCDGLLVVNDDLTITQTLLFPIEDKEGKDAFKTLEYKARLNVSLLHLHMNGIKPGDNDGRLLAHVAALTAKPKELIKKIDTEDYGIALSIAVFFV